MRRSPVSAELFSVGHICTACVCVGTCVYMGTYWEFTQHHYLAGLGNSWGPSCHPDLPKGVESLCPSFHQTGCPLVSKRLLSVPLSKCQCHLERTGAPGCLCPSDARQREVSEEGELPPGGMPEPHWWVRLQPQARPTALTRMLGSSRECRARTIASSETRVSPLVWISSTAIWGRRSAAVSAGSRALARSLRASQGTPPARVAAVEPLSRTHGSARPASGPGTPQPTRSGSLRAPWQLCPWGLFLSTPALQAAHTGSRCRVLLSGHGAEGWATQRAPTAPQSAWTSCAEQHVSPWSSTAHHCPPP